MSKPIKKEKPIKKPLKMVAPKEPGNVPREEIDIIQKGKDKGLTYTQIRDKVNSWRDSQDRPQSMGKKGMFNLISRVISNKGNMVDKAEEKWGVYEERNTQFKSIQKTIKRIKGKRNRAKVERSLSLIWNKPKGRQNELIASYDAEGDTSSLCTPPC